MYSFKQKIKILQKILNKSVKYSKSFNKMECSVDGKIIRIEQELKNKDFPNSIIKFPVSDIDIVILRERAKLLSYKNYEPKGLNEAIEEEDIMNLRDTIKEEME